MSRSSSGRKRRPRIVVRPGIVILAALFLLFDRRMTALIPLGAAVCHELGHLLAMRLCGVQVNEFTLTMFGAQIEKKTACLCPACSIFISLAGPCANLLCASAVSLCGIRSLDAEIFCACSLTLAMLNLLPIRSLDGGCALAELVGVCGSDTARRAADILSAATLLFLWIGAVYILLLCGGNFSLFALCACLFAELYLQ